MRKVIADEQNRFLLENKLDKPKRQGTFKISDKKAPSPTKVAPGSPTRKTSSPTKKKKQPELQI